jgi:serine protease
VGKALVKLTERATAQTLRAVELEGDDSVQSTDVPSLDQRLIEIGGSLEPIVAIALPDSDLGSLSVQTTEVSQIFTVSFSPDRDVQEVTNILEQDPAVEYAEPDFIGGITAAPRRLPLPPMPMIENSAGLLTPHDPYFRYQWHMQTIQMPTAWDTATGQGIKVAVVDTGVDFRAPDLAGTAHDTGHDFANNDDDPTDDQGHGTHVAGTIAQSTNNGVGVAGVAFNARLLPVKVLGANGQGSYSNIIKGIVYAVDQEAKVINMSLAGSSGSQALRDAVQYANSKGVVVVAAAGNSGGAVQYPAAYDEFVIGVGAVRNDLQRPAYSNFGPEIDLMAPGGDLSVDQNGDTYADGVLQQTFRTPGTFTYLFYEGTSMASPHVAGLAALILSRDSSLTPAMVENLMAQTAKAIGSGNQNGAGVIQAAAVLAALGGPTGPTPTSTFTPSPTPTFTSTPIPSPTFTPTPTPAPVTPPISEHGADLTPAPVCTPPACQPGEVYYCPGDCPGGCGTQCATPTPGITPIQTTPPPGPTTPAPGPTTPSNIRRTADGGHPMCSGNRSFEWKCDTLLDLFWSEPLTFGDTHDAWPS